MSLDTIRRAGITLLTGAVVTAGLATIAPAPQAQAATTNVAVDSAVAWLDAQLTAGVLDADANKLGTTLDLGLGLVATGSSPATLATVRTGVDANLAAYVGTEGDEFKAGRVGKAAHFYAATGADPSAAAGIDLIDRLEGLVDDETGLVGTADPVNVYDYVWIVPALDAAGSADADVATDALIAAACDNGGWGYEWDGCNTDIDATAWAILALLPQVDDAAVSTAVDAAVAWLKTQQLPDGAFGAWGANSNSTGLAGWALHEVGADVEAARAATWIRRHQVIGAACDGKLSTDPGAIAFDDDALANGIADGITAGEVRGQWVLSTAQAFPALLAAPASTKPLAVSAPRFVKAGSTVTLKTTGLASGQRGCATLAGRSATATGGVRTWTPITVPKGTRAYTAVTRTLGGQASVKVTALAPKALPVRLRAKRVAARRLQAVRVTGLVRGERVVVRYRGAVIATGVANSDGAFGTSFRVGRSKGIKTVAVQGQFSTRRGSATFRVV